MQKSTGDFPIVIVNMPASERVRRAAFGLVIALWLIFLAIAPLASMPLARVDAFIPVLQTVLCVAEGHVAGRIARLASRRIARRFWPAE